LTHPIRIYQVGDVQLRLFEEEWHGYDSSFSSKPNQMLLTDQYVWMNRQFQPSPRSISISGQLIGEGTNTKDAKINRLNQLAGAPTDVFAFVFAACCEDADCGCNCPNRGFTKDLLWVHTRGAIEKVDARSGSNGNFPIQVSINIAANWQPVNRFIWAFQPGAFNNYYEFPIPSPPESALWAYPLYTAVEGCTGRNIWAKRVYEHDLIMYEPEVWEVLHEFHRPNYPFATGRGSDFFIDPAIEYSIYSDYAVWSSTPSSVYAFRTLPQSGIITFEVEKELDAWATHVETSTIDLAELDAELNAKGFTQLELTDIVYVGNTKFKPGFVVRSGAILENVQVNADYPGKFVGETGVNLSRIRVYTPAGVNQAFLHTYRRL
jgi:hypothetical protein